MDSKKKINLEETYERIINVGLCIVPYEDLSDFVAPELMLFGTTKDEKVFSFSELDAMFKSQYEQMAGFVPSLDRKRLSTQISGDGNNAFITEEVTLTISSPEEVNTIFIRCSCVMEYIDNQWKLTHWHASTPVDTENDHWHIEEWKREKEKLQKLVDKQTADLHTKNRELEIEAAIERVRARTMAMQYSDELTEASEVLDDQVRALGIETWGCAFHIYADDPEGDYEWFSSREGTLPFYKTPREKFFLTFYEKGQAGETFHVEKFLGDDCKAHYDYLMTLPVIGDALQEMVDAGGSLPESQYDHIAFFKHGFLLFITYEPVPEAYEVFKRFAKVFEQTYTRFLDLQKAEAQAREAKIETTLEKVRSRSLAMHKSEELLDVITVVSDQLQLLNFRFDHVSFANNEIDKDYKFWTSVKGMNPLRFNVPYIDIPILTNLKSAQQNGVKFHTDILTQDENRQWHEYLLKHGGSEVFSNEMNEYTMGRGIARSIALNPNIILILANYASVPYTEEDNKIIARFGRVFEQSYTRFLDLQKAETQALEAQIEAALERLRARSMGMHHSTELIEVVRLLDREIKGLGIQNVDATQIITDFSDPDEGLNIWIMVEKMDYLEKFHTPYIDHPVTSNLFEAFKKKEKFCTEKYSKVEKNRFLRLLFKYSDFKSVPKERQAVLLNSPGLVRSLVIHKNSALIFQHNGLNEFSKEDNAIFKRFGVVFEQAYTRFLDLQKAEKQAAEAIKQASLDRVRGEIASMRSSDDLENITPLIWSELKTLDVSFIRCGVFIIHEDEHQVEVYLSKPDGTSLAVMHLPIDSNELAADTFEAWQNREVFTQRWSQQEFLDFGKGLIEQKQISDLESYQGAEEAPESLHLHFIPFNQGMLYVGSTGSLNDEEINLSESLAKAFSIAYARYEDFVKLEKAKVGIEDALSELKATQSQLVQQEKLASLGQLTAGIAHEIKNPLNFVNNFSELSVELVQETKDELSAISDQLSVEDQERVNEAIEILNDIEANLKKVHEHGSRADSIVKSMLEHSRGGTGKPEPTDLNSLVKEFVNLSFHGMRAGKDAINVDLQIEMDDSVGKVPLVAEDFSRVIVNLCNNAFDAMREKGIQNEKMKIENYSPKLTVRTRTENGQVIIEIEDNGPGIPDEIKDKILQPFFTTKKGTQGTGLGLSITNDIIKAHGGELTIQSKPNKGSLFTILLTEVY